MTKLIQRQTLAARIVHGFHTASTLLLFATGLMIFVPAIAHSIGVGPLETARLLHRVAAVVFIGIPLGAIVFFPKGFMHHVHDYFEKWTPEDWEFMRKFVPYLFVPQKVHMPPQPRLKSGQKVADLAIIVFAVLVAISGAILWGGRYFPPQVLRINLLVHDVSMTLVGILLIAHAYLGAGIFKPYRRSARLMFGDGKITESDARYHWGEWADEEIKSGKDVTEGS